MYQVKMEHSVVGEFLNALGSGHTYSPCNTYTLFGFLWGLPVPVFSIGVDMYLSGQVLSLDNIWQTIANHPVHFIFLIHPILFAVIFGAMGTVRHHKMQAITRLIDDLQAKTDELAAANNQMKQLDQMKSVFVTNINNEIKSLTSAIEHCVPFAQDHSNPPRCVKVIDESQRIHRTLNDLQELSRIQSKKLTLRLARFNLSELITDTLQSFKGQAVSRQISVQLELPQDHAYVWADREMVALVLTHLLSNAIKFTPNSGTIGIKLQTVKAESKVYLDVNDTGSGIPEEEQRHLFDRFWQGKVGLGLAICKGILDIHGSRIRVKSKVGQGTTFSFDLPLIS